MGCLPFGGYSDGHRCEPDLRMENINRNLLKKQIKHLKINWFPKSPHCVLTKFMLNPLTRECPMLKHLQLFFDSSDLSDINLNGGQLPSLKIVKLMNDNEWLSDANYHLEVNQKLNFATMIARAPNLQTLQNEISLKWIQLQRNDIEQRYWKLTEGVSCHSYVQGELREGFCSLSRRKTIKI